MNTSIWYVDISIYYVISHDDVSWFSMKYVEVWQVWHIFDMGTVGVLATKFTSQPSHPSCEASENGALSTKVRVGSRFGRSFDQWPSWGHGSNVMTKQSEAIYQSHCKKDPQKMSRSCQLVAPKPSKGLRCSNSQQTPHVAMHVDLQWSTVCTYA